MEKDNKDKKIVLFGCGEMGHQVLHRLGNGNVLCFCDNNQALWKTEKWGMPVLSLEELKAEYHNYMVVVCAKLPKAYFIAAQLDDEGVSDYWIYPVIEQKIADLPVEGALKYLCDREAMFRMRMEFYQMKIERLEEQLDYMKGHADIRSMKPATGALRERQLALADLGEFFCQAVGEFGVRPFLCGGNLLGYVRNGHFIPWDDDMDFNLIREDYECLRQYCLKQRDEEGYISFRYEGRMEKLSFYEHYKMFGLMKGVFGKPSLSLEFFSLDYYADNYPFETLRAEAKRIQTDVYD